MWSNGHFRLKDVKLVYYLINQSTFTFWFSYESRHNIAKHELWRHFFSKEVLTTFNLIRCSQQTQRTSFIFHSLTISFLLVTYVSNAHYSYLLLLSNTVLLSSISRTWPRKYYGQHCFYLQPPRCWGDGSHSPGISWRLRSSGSKQFPAMWVSDWSNDTDTSLLIGCRGDRGIGVTLWCTLD